MNQSGGDDDRDEKEGGGTTPTPWAPTRDPRRKSPRIGAVLEAESSSRVDRICARTGLVLRPAAQQVIWRVAKASYGALYVPPRPEGSDRADWGRYDVAGHRTAYGASPPEAAYAEALASQRLTFTHPAPAWGELFDDAPPSGAESLLQVVAREWHDRGYMAPGTVSAGWRHDRLIYELRLPDSGWFVDVEHEVSIRSISRALKGQLEALGLEHLALSDLRSERRELTTAIAAWLREQLLDDGSLPHGVEFGSRHDRAWRLWAIWLRRVDAGADVSAEPTKADGGRQIAARDENAELDRTARLFGLDLS